MFPERLTVKNHPFPYLLGKTHSPPFFMSPVRLTEDPLVYLWQGQRPFPIFLNLLVRADSDPQTSCSNLCPLKLARYGDKYFLFTWLIETSDCKSIPTINHPTFLPMKAWDKTAQPRHSDLHIWCALPIAIPQIKSISLLVCFSLK